MNSIKKFLPAVLGVGIFLLTACDPDYDLSKDISSEIQIGSGFSIPIGETDTLYLSRIIKLDDAINVDENGNYALAKSGALDVDVPSIDKIKLSGISARPIIENIFPKGYGSALVPKEFKSDLLSFQSSIDSEESVPSEIVELSAIVFEPTKSILEFKIEFDNPSTLNKIKEIHLKDFSIAFPKEFVFSNDPTIRDNVMYLDDKVITNGILSIPLVIEDIKDLPKINQQNHTIYINKQLKFNGVITGVLKDGQQMTGDELSSMILRTAFNVPDIEISRVEGVFNPDIKINAEKISMGDLPDVLVNENTTIDINTIIAKLEISNPVGIPFDAKLMFSALDKNNRLINTQVPVNISIPSAIDYATPQNCKFFVTSNDNLTAPAGYIKVYAPELNKLISKIPEYIEINPTVTINKSKSHFIELGVTKETNANYDVTMPFDFGENSNINYTETYDNIQDDLADIVDKISEIEVYTDIKSTIPLNLVLNAVPYDYNGNNLSQSVEISKDINIAPGDENAPVQTKTILIREIEKGSLKNLDKIMIEIKGNTNGASTVLKPSQYVLVSLKAKLPDGISVDLDD